MQNADEAAGRIFNVENCRKSQNLCQLIHLLNIHVQLCNVMGLGGFWPVSTLNPYFMFSKKATTRPRAYTCKTFFILSSAEHEIYPAHKC